METFPKCVECGDDMHDVRSHRRFCSPKCKGRWQRKNKPPHPIVSHDCRQCGTTFPIGPGQNNKWLCSDDCRRAAAAASVRNFHERHPLAETIYRAASKERLPADSQLRRFYGLNPDAPRACQSCGETRVLEMAHRPGHERLGVRRSSLNMQWPEKTWVLCPTCHRLLDRMRYTPAELGLE